MNVVVGSVVTAPGGTPVRRETILVAAEACFVRNGFHRTTMQDIAREAAMSPANIYRYFESKDDVVVSLAARETHRAEIILVGLQAKGDRWAELTAIVDAYFVDAPREAAVLRLEIWSECTRNPRFAALAREQEAQFRCWFTAMLASLAASPDRDVDGLYDLAVAVLKGMLVDRALLAEFDPKPVAARLYALLKAGLADEPPTPSDPTGPDR